MADMNPVYFLLAVVIGCIGQIVLGAVRWGVSLRQAYGVALPFGTLLKHYWTGMFVGYFVPGGVGWDLYRVVQANREKPAMLKHIVVVMMEKMMGIATCVLLPLILWPFLQSEIRVNDPRIIHAMNVLCGAAVIFILAMSLVIFFRRLFSALLRIFVNWLATGIDRMCRRRGWPEVSARRIGVLHQGVKACLLSASALRLWGLTLTIRALAVLAAYWVLLGMGCRTSMLAQWFAISLMGFIFLLPISFGSIGVREGSFIMLYGMFGITREQALAASFVGLLAMLITIGVGGVVMLVAPPVSSEVGITR